MARSPQQQLAAEVAIRAFDFGDYGMDYVEASLHDNPDQQEWVADLAAAVAEAVLAAAGPDGA
jgi:hypothetical protein